MELSAASDAASALQELKSFQRLTEKSWWVAVHPDADAVRQAEQGAGSGQVFLAESPSRRILEW
jgi:hypothetical protein